MESTVFQRTIQQVYRPQHAQDSNILFDCEQKVESCFRKCVLRFKLSG